MRRIILLLLAAAAISAVAAETQVKGHLVDMACAREEGQKTGFGAKHSKMCLQMPECQKSGYGVLTEDKKVIRFDAASNEKAQKFIADLSKEKDIKVTVTGTMNGDQFAVSKIELQ
jgi:predicted RNA-binding protein Jag